jgi:hypothetical protein
MVDEMALNCQFPPLVITKVARLKKNKITMASKAKMRKNQLRKSVVISYLAIENML